MLLWHTVQSTMNFLIVILCYLVICTGFEFEHLGCFGRARKAENASAYFLEMKNFAGTSAQFWEQIF